MDNITTTIKVWGRNEWLYWAYSKIKSNIQRYLGDTFEANQIVDNLWLGSLESSCNRQALQERGIETVICAILGASAMFPFDFKYERAKLRDVEDENIIDEFDKLLPIIHTELLNNRAVICHCIAGRSRSASIVAAYLIRYHNMTTEDSLKFIKNKRTQINPNPGYVKQLKIYEERVRDGQNYSVEQDKKYN